MKRLLIYFFVMAIAASCGSRSDSIEKIEAKEADDALSVLSEDETLAFRDSLVTISNPIFESMNSLIKVAARLLKQKMKVEDFGLTLDDVLGEFDKTRKAISFCDSCVIGIKEIDPELNLVSALSRFNSATDVILKTSFADLIDKMRNDISKDDHDDLAKILQEIMDKMKNVEAEFKEVINKFDAKYKIYE